MRIPALNKANDTFASLSKTGRALFYFFAALLVLSCIGLVYTLDHSFLFAAPMRGGSLVEGEIGSPRFINPILAISDPDRDLTSLVYSGLLKATPQGTYVPDLAQSYEISPDGTTYTFHLRPDATFQDGTPVTSADVAFTIEKAQDSALKSPEEADWSGVQVQTPDAHTVVFILQSAYAPFIENTTLGILPKHLWQNVSDDDFPFSDLNTNPVGSGPYKVASIGRDSGGIPSSYTLSAFANYALGEPYLTTLTFKFYQSEDDLTNALSAGDVEAASGLSPADIAAIPGEVTDTAPLDRVFGVFFNQNQSAVLRDSDVREALNDAIDREALVESVLGGYGEPIDGPLPPGVAGASDSAPTEATTTNLALAAQQQLLADGWQLENGVLTKTDSDGTTETLEFTLATADVPELRAAAEYLREQWGQMGAKVDVQVYEQGDLTENVIRPRKYDALLFGEVVGREADLFAFWDSSQRNDPGLNIAMYANPTADQALEAMRETTDPSQRESLYQQFLTQIQTDVPAVFLYAPDFVYTVPNDLKGLDLGFIETPSDRFLSVTDWYRQEDYVWPAFVPK